MKKNRTKLRRLFFLTGAIFVLVFALRFSYDLFFDSNVNRQPDVFGLNYSVSLGLDRPFLLQNIATDRIVQRDIAGNTVAIDQKYEKTANISSISHNFDNDHERLRHLIENYDAMVQAETLRGLPGDQTLTITIGVAPDQFDDMVNSLRELGTLRSFTVNRVDKTDEFNNLLAQQEVLRMTRESYAALQALGGSIQDMLLLQDRILQVETELQHLGVSLGIFDTGHSFCTINLTLREQEPSFITLQFVVAIAFSSLAWTAAAVAITLSIALGMLGAIALGLWLWDKVKKYAIMFETKREDSLDD